jgi:hypothetical protein
MKLGAFAVAAALALASAAAAARLPPMTAEQKAAAAASAARAAEAAREDAELLAKYQDLTVEKYGASRGAVVPGPRAAFHR